MQNDLIVSSSSDNNFLIGISRVWKDVDARDHLRMDGLERLATCRVIVRVD